MGTEDRERLNSWKAIANHLGCSVRTARRWEKDEDLPVHRHMHRSQGRVYGIRCELDRWRENRRSGPGSPAASPADPGGRGLGMVVLPFAFIGPDANEAYLADGFTEEIIGHLSGLGDLRVISRTSSMALKNRDHDARSLGRQLGVRYLLEGAVRCAPDRVRVNVSLIDAKRDERTWTDKLDGAPDDIFGLQERIARSVARALEVRLSPVEDRRLSRRATDDVQAWRFAQQARISSLRWRKDAIDHAIALLNRGLARDPDSIELLAQLGKSWLQYREAGIDPGPEPLAQARACARRMAAIEPLAQQGLQLEAWIHYAEGDIERAVARLKKALERDPAGPDNLNLLANCYLIAGRISQARPLIDQLLDVDPLTPLNRCMPGWASVLEGDLEAGIAPYREMYEMDPGNPMGRLFYLWVLVLNDRRDEALALYDGFSNEALQSAAGRVASLFAGSLRNAGAPLKAADPVSPEQCNSDVFPRLLAEAHALSGNNAGAVRWLAEAVRHGFINYPFLARHNPMFHDLRGDPDFQALLEDVRRRWEAFDG